MRAQLQQQGRPRGARPFAASAPHPTPSPATGSHASISSATPSLSPCSAPGLSLTICLEGVCRRVLPRPGLLGRSWGGAFGPRPPLMGPQAGGGCRGRRRAEGGGRRSQRGEPRATRRRGSGPLRPASWDGGRGPRAPRSRAPRSRAPPCRAHLKVLPSCALSTHFDTLRVGGAADAKHRTPRPLWRRRRQRRRGRGGRVCARGGAAGGPAAGGLAFGRLAPRRANVGGPQRSRGARHLPPAWTAKRDRRRGGVPRGTPASKNPPRGRQGGPRAEAREHHGYRTRGRGVE